MKNLFCALSPHTAPYLCLWTSIWAYSTLKLSAIVQMRAQSCQSFIKARVKHVHVLTLTIKSHMPCYPQIAQTVAARLKGLLRLMLPERLSQVWGLFFSSSRCDASFLKNLNSLLVTQVCIKGTSVNKWKRKSIWRAHWLKIDQNILALASQQCSGD